MIAKLLVALAASPSPGGTVPDPDTVTPGIVGFVVTFFIAVATLLLIFDMVRRIRRTRYRSEIAEKLDAEETHATGDDDPARAGDH